MELEREELIKHCENTIEKLEKLDKEFGDALRLDLKRNILIFQIALGSLKAKAPCRCEHDGATYYDLSGRERCTLCGADL